MTENLKKYVYPSLFITLVFSIVYWFFHDFRFADPDQYFHFAVSRHLAETWDFWHLPQVKGVGWDVAFSDKEFLFHLMTSVFYKLFGPAGVLYVCFLFSLSILLMIYLITLKVSEKVYLSLFAALFPLFTETYLLKLMQIRAFLPAVFLVLLMIYFMISRRKVAVLISAALFSLTYHALPVPAVVFLIWGFSQWISGERSDRSAAYGIVGLLLGMIVNPYFPANVVMMVVHLKVALSQFQPTGLDFGPETTPYRSDNLLLLFRFVFLFLALGIAMLLLKFKNSSHIKKITPKVDSFYLFFNILSFSFFCLLFLTPRVQEYTIPFVAIYGALTLLYFVREKFILVGLTGLMVCYLALFKPLANFSHTTDMFQQFDNSYFDLVKTIPAPAYVFNCEWWGGHYVMMARPDLQTMDILDPTFLRSESEETFRVVTALRQGQASDPYHVLKKILKVNYVLCSTKTPINAQLLVDPRFQKVQQASNVQEELYLYRLRGDQDVAAISQFDYRTVQQKEWLPLPRHETDPSLVYVTPPLGAGCIALKPTADELKKLTSYDAFSLSGTGTVSVYGDGELYLKPTILSNQLRWGELLMPLDSKVQDWQFQICPDQKGRASLGVFLLTQHQQDLYCGSDKTPIQGSKQKRVFEGLPDRCASARVR